jgi:hypothetical protein
VLEQSTRGRCDARPALAPPSVDLAADPVDEVVLLDSVARPLRVEVNLRLLLGRGDRHEVRALAALLDDLARDPLLAEAEVARGLAEGRVEDRVVDGGVGHGGRSEVHDFSAGMHGETAGERRVGGEKRSAEGLTQRGVEGVSRGEITTQHPRTRVKGACRVERDRDLS